MKVRIEWIYMKNKGPSTHFVSEEMELPKAVMIAEDLEKTGRMKELVFIDSEDQSWNLKQARKLIKTIEEEPTGIKLYFDGGYDHSTRKAGLGCVIYYEQNQTSYRLRKNALVDELTSNNEAEYAALHLAIKEMERLGIHHSDVAIIGDSQVVIQQLSDEWPVLEQGLSNWADRIEEDLDRLQLAPDYKIVSRKKNKEADRLASQALKHIVIESLHQVNGDV